MNQRIVISAAAAVSPVGTGLTEIFAALAAGRPGCERIRNFAADVYPSQLGAEVKDQGVVMPHPSACDRKEIFLRQALEQLAYAPAFQTAPPAERLLHLGAGIDYFDLPGYCRSAAAGSGDWQSHSRNTLRMARQLASEFAIQGEVAVNVTACVASSQALGLAFRRLKQLPATAVAISGGVDSMLNPLHYMGFHKLGALSDWSGAPAEACRPFDKNRRGLVLGEGAALFCLQHAASARPESVLGEIVGYASTMDAYMVTDPDPSGSALARAASLALAEAGLTPDAIDCVHLHGTGTHKNELAEAAAMQSLFPTRYRELPVFSMKGQIGHLIAGCGAMELLGVLFSLHTQSVPPTVNFCEPDPAVPLRVVSGQPLRLPIEHVLKLNAAFGGQNTALVVKRYEP
jgi:3-oxoacyl-[acyl-carrier-protein] synthase II